MKDIEKVVYLCSRIVQGVKENYKDSTNKSDDEQVINTVSK